MGALFKLTVLKQPVCASCSVGVENRPMYTACNMRITLISLKDQQIAQLLRWQINIGIPHAIKVMLIVLPMNVTLH